MTDVITVEKTGYTVLNEWTEKSIPVKQDGESLEQKFRILVKEWKNEISHLSSMTKIVMHPKYQNIIGMGPAVLPILFR